MSHKIRVLECANQLSLGGTEYALQLYCKYLNKDIFDVIAVALYSGGARVQLIEDLGIHVEVLNGDLERFRTLLNGTEVLHWHGSGSIDEGLFNLIKDNKPKLFIQTNVFGYYTKSNLYDLIDFDLFISKMILVRRMNKDGNAYPDKRKALPYPVDIDFLTNAETIPTTADLLNLKNEYKLNGHFVVGRIGRADDHKFDLITLDGFKEYLKLNSVTKFLLVGATKKMLAYAEKIGVYENLVVLKNTSDIKELLAYYKLMDVFLAASNIGESFGMVMAESMCMGTPVVTVSTPDRDNAQVEVVDNMLTGLVVPRLKKQIALALNEVCTNKSLRASFSVNSVKKIKASYRAQDVVGSLENLIFRQFNLPINNFNNLISDWDLELKAEYKKRTNDLFGGLNFSDRAQLWFEKSLLFKLYQKLSKA